MAEHERKKDPRFWLVWSPQGGPPVVPIGSFEGARVAANRLSKKFPAQDFYVLASCWGRPAMVPAATRTPEAPAPSCPSLEAS